MQDLFNILFVVGFIRALSEVITLPDFKPFNCLSCLSFWTALIAFYFLDIPLHYAFIVYLTQRLL